jgi:hypothetical protein
MHTTPDQHIRHLRPRLHTRTILFGVLLCLFAVVLLLASRQVALTKTGLPTETHPSLLGDRDDVDVMRGRLDREPYRTWERRLLAQADAIDADVKVSEVEIAHRAKALAFAFSLSGERRYADKALRLFVRAKRPSCGGKWRELDEVVAGAADYALAYDLMAPHLRSHQALDTKMRMFIEELAGTLYRERYVWPSPGGDTREIRQACALGLCALAIRGAVSSHSQPGPRAWYTRARRQLATAFEHQICRDGGYSEGPGRHFEAAEVYLPFFAASKRVMGEDLLTGDALQACEWGARIRMPDGLRPALDSSVLTPSCSYLAAALAPKSKLLSWDAATSDLGGTVPAEQLPEALALYDDSTPAARPAGHPSEVLNASGNIVFRSDWGPTANYLLLLAEHGRARSAGGVYEQPDSSSLVLCRGPETLVMDTGWGGWARRQDTSGGRAHNLVLMDNQGPPVKTALGAIVAVDVEAQLTDSILEREVDAVRVRRMHDQAIFDRTVIFANRRDYIVFDRQLAGQGTHDFTWQLHLNAGGTTGGHLVVDKNTAKVTRDAAALKISLYSSHDGGNELTTDEAIHYLHEGQPERHAVLRATARNRDQVSFLAVLSPTGPAAQAPGTSSHRDRGWMGLELGSTGHGAFRTDGSAIIGDDGVRTDGYALYWEADASGHPRYVLIMGASRLWLQGNLVWKARQRETTVWRPRAAARPS